MKVKNKELIQSYILTSAKYKFSVHEKRILYRLVEIAQCQLAGQELNSGFTIQEDLFGDYKITMPLSSLNKEGARETKRIKDALTDLRNKTIIFDDGKVWKLMGIIEKPKLVYEGHMEIEVHKEIYEAILNFSKGFRKFELTTAFNLESTYSMRVYELIVNQKDLPPYRIDTLREMWGLQDKYPVTKDFLKRTLDKAKKELDKSSPWSFTYTKIKTGRKVTSVKLYPKYIPKNADPELEKKKAQKQTSPAWDLDKEFIRVLEEKFSFTRKGIMSNIDLFLRCQNEIEDVYEWLGKMKGKSRVKNPDNPQGFLITAIRIELKKINP